MVGKYAQKFELIAAKFTDADVADVIANSQLLQYIVNSC